MSGWNVKYCTEDPGFLPGVFTVGWTVGWVNSDGDRFAVPLMFGRSKDAEIAVNAVEQIGPWGDCVSEIQGKILEYGKNNFRKLLCRDLAW